MLGSTNSSSRATSKVVNYTADSCWATGPPRIIHFSQFHWSRIPDLYTHVSCTGQTDYCSSPKCKTFPSSAMPPGIFLPPLMLCVWMILFDIINKPVESSLWHTIKYFLFFPYDALISFLCKKGIQQSAEERALWNQVLIKSLDFMVQALW